MERAQDPGTPGFYSRLFLVPKKNGKLHPVIDISLINQYIRKQPFKMIQSQTPIVCISSSGQSCLSDGRIVIGLELSSRICIPTDNSDTICTSQDSTISVQNSSYSPSVVSTSVVLRGVTSISIFCSFQNC